MTTKIEWLKERQKGIGGTDVAAIFGLNPWKTPVQVWEEKISTLPVEQEDTPAMRAGRKLEKAIAEWFSEETGLAIEKAEDLIKHKKYPILLANPDYFYLDGDKKGVLEIKTASRRSFDNWDDEIPVYYWTQIQHYMYVCDLKKGKFAVLVGGRDFRIIDVERDEEWLEIAVPKLLEWWDKHVNKKIPPDPTSDEDWNIIYPKSKPIEIEASEVVFKLVEEWKKIKAKISELKAHKEELEFQIKTVMKEAEILKYKGLPIISWKTSERSYFDTKQFKEDFPDLYKEYSKKRNVRTLRELKIKLEDN